MNGAEAIVPVTMFAGGFAMVFGIYYLRTRQNLAMIEKGMNPKEFANRPVLDGSVQTDHHDGRNVPIYFSLIAIGGGLGLFGSYKMEKKWWDDNKDKV